MNQYEVFKGNDKQWYWRLVAKNNKIVAQSEGYKRRSQAIKAAQRMPEIAKTTAIVENLGIVL
jgi:uncharacterized protein YegP (UPF0339 family)